MIITPPPSPAAEISKEFLKPFLMDTYALQLKTHVFYWNVTGAQFYNLHLLFEIQHKDLCKATDLIAERIRALGWYAPGGIKHFAAETSLDDPGDIMDSDFMLRQLIADHETLAWNANEGLEAALDNKDNVTADMLTERAQDHQKQVWIMDSILEKGLYNSATMR